uniref:Uncharacterized protein n=1 Tax=Triticum urartu TaxID=4572 RepID=A0A8R7TP61_TRIUA
ACQPGVAPAARRFSARHGPRTPRPGTADDGALRPGVTGCCRRLTPCCCWQLLTPSESFPVRINCGDFA